jgi:hypothetical protein
MPLSQTLYGVSRTVGLVGLEVTLEPSAYLRSVT